MNPKRFSIRLAIALLLATSVLLLGSTVGLPRKEAGRGPATITLKAPPFVGVANAQEGPQSVANFLEDEAGISAYTRTPFPIDLSLVRDLFRTIERETNTYIIGSIPLSGYRETEDVHVYVHIEGWVLAYYLAQDPAGKIVDWIGYNGTEITSTKLKKALAVVCNQVGAVPFDASYYDFRYPNATHLMILADATYGGSAGGSDSFEIKLPGNFVFYQRSWSLAVQHTSGPNPGAYFYLNGTEIARVLSGGWYVVHGTLTQTQLPPGSFHTVSVSRWDANAFGGLVLIYREVP